MAIGDDHKMPVVVGITVKNNGVVSFPKENKILLVFLVPQKGTEKAAGTLSGVRAQIRLAPRSPH